MSSMRIRLLGFCLLTTGLFAPVAEAGEKAKGTLQPGEEPLVFAKVRVLAHCNGIPGGTSFTVKAREIEYIKKLGLEPYYRIPKRLTGNVGKDLASYEYTWAHYNPTDRIPPPDDALSLPVCVPPGTLADLTKPLLKVEPAEREKQFVIIAEGRLVVAGADETLNWIVQNGAYLFGKARIERREKAPKDLALGFLHIEGQVVDLDKLRHIKRTEPWEIRLGIRNGLEPLAMPQSYFALPPLKKGLVQVVAGQGRGELLGPAMTIEPKRLLLRDEASAARHVVRAEIGKGGGEAEFKELAKHPHLEQLVVFRDAKLTDKGLAIIVGLKHLRQLRLHLGDKVTDQGFKALTGLQQARELVLTGPGITDARLKNHFALKGLEELTLGNCKALTREGLLALKGCDSLRTLRILDCPAVSEADVKQVQEAMPRCKVSYKLFVFLP